MSPELLRQLGPETTSNGKLQLPVAMELCARVKASGAELYWEYVDKDITSDGREPGSETVIDRLWLGVVVVSPPCRLPDRPRLPPGTGRQIQPIQTAGRAMPIRSRRSAVPPPRAPQHRLHSHGGRLRLRLAQSVDKEALADSGLDRPRLGDVVALQDRYSRYSHGVAREQRALGIDYDQPREALDSSMQAFIAEMKAGELRAVACKRDRDARRARRRAGGRHEPTSG